MYITTKQTTPTPISLIYFFLSFLAVSLTLFSQVAFAANEAVPYWVYDTTNDVLTFKYGELPENGTQIDLNTTFSWNESGDVSGRSWHFGSLCRDVEIDPSFSSVTILHPKLWFANLGAVTSLTGLENLRFASNVDAEFFFGTFPNPTAYSEIKWLNLPSLNTDNFSSFQCMFYLARYMEALDCSNWTFSQASSVKNFMLNQSPGTKQVDFSSMDTHSLTDVSGLYTSTTCSIFTISSSYFNKADMPVPAGNYWAYKNGAPVSGDVSGPITASRVTGEGPTTFILDKSATYRAYFDANGGAWDDDTDTGLATKYATFTEGGITDTIAAPSIEPKRSGYTFAGWKTATSDDVITSFGKYGISPHFGYYATWKEIVPEPTVDLTFDASPGVFMGAGGLPSSLKYTNRKVGSSFSFTGGEYPVLEGADLQGWKAEGSDTILQMPITVPNINTTYKAVWKPIVPPEIKQVTFYADPGTFASGTSELKDSAVRGMQIDGPSEKPSYEGHTLVGWKDTADQMVTFPYVVENDISFYAVWKDDLENGWHQSDAGWQYMVDGVYVTGWKWIDDSYGAHWYYFNADTYMACSQWQWDEANSSWYWLCSSGPMMRGLWQWIDNEWYGFWWNGKMCRGWVWDAGWQKWFYCYSNGVMARNTWEGPYWLNWQGIWTR